MSVGKIFLNNWVGLCVGKVGLCQVCNELSPCKSQLGNFIAVNVNLPASLSTENGRNTVGHNGFGLCEVADFQHKCSLEAQS